MRSSFILHLDLLPTVDMLSNAELGKVIKAVFHYNVYGEMPDNLSRTASVLFQQIKAQHDRDSKHYEEISEKRSKAGALKKKEPPEEDRELLALRDKLRAQISQ